MNLASTLGYLGEDDNPSEYDEEQDDPLQEQIAAAFLGCVSIDTRVLNPNWGTGEHANRPLQAGNVTRLKKALLVFHASLHT